MAADSHTARRRRSRKIRVSLKPISAVPGRTRVLKLDGVGAYLVDQRTKVRGTLSEVYDRFPRLAERRKQFAGTLSGGEQQMLVFGRAMMTQPKLLMLDEPSLGLAPLMVDEVMRSIRVFRESGVTVFLVEQNANLALRLADRAYVMETGKITMSGSGAQLLADERGRAGYLGPKDPT